MGCGAGKAETYVAPGGQAAPGDTAPSPVASPTTAGGMAKASNAAAGRGEASTRACTIQSKRKSIDEDFEISDEPLGAGHTGLVHLATQRDSGLSFCVKIIRRKGKNIGDIEQEVERQKSLDHPHICRVHEAYLDAKCYYIVMEYLAGGNLLDRVAQSGSLGEKSASRLMQQLAKAVAHMHSRSLCHGDVKPENALFVNSNDIADAELKLIDFGHAQWFDDPKAKMQKLPDAPRMGSYTSPEVFKDAFTPSCDVWSLGVITHVLVTGSAPFLGNDVATLKAQVGKGVAASCCWASWPASPAAKAFVELAMQPAASRCSVAELLEHPWIKDGAAQAADVPADLMDNLRTFQQQNKLQKTACALLAQYLASDQTAQLREMFLELDANSDGTLTFSELEVGIKKLGGSNPNLVKLFKNLDTDGSQVIEYSEFLAAAMDVKSVRDEHRCWEVFKQFDNDGDGTITRDELTYVLSGGEAHTFEEVCGKAADEIKDIVMQMDLNGDGRLDFDEFLDLMNNAKA